MNLGPIQLTSPYWLLVTPLLWLLLWRLHKTVAHNSYWQQVLPAAFQPWLLQTGHSRWAQLPWLLAALASLLAGIALSSPHTSHPADTPSTLQPQPLVVVMELTPDMLARDLLPDRLHQMRDKALSILQTRTGGLTALVVYAGSAHSLMPLASDPALASELLQALHPSLMPKAGRNAAAGVARALQLLDSGANGQGQIILLTHALSADEQQPLVQLLGKRRVQLAILGVGSPQGAPIPAAQRQDGNTDPRLSRLHEQSLQQFARRHGFDYARLHTDHSDLLQTGLLVRDDSGRLQAPRTPQPVDRGYWVLLPLLLLLAPLARRGWLFVPLLALLPALYADPSLADSPTRRLVEQDPIRALQTLEDPMWLGIAAYHAGDYPLAVEYFSTLNSAMGYYNLGNSLMQLARYDTAAQAYERALQLQPDLQPAIDNRALAYQLADSARQETNGTGLPTPHGDTPAGQPVPDAKTATLNPPLPDFQQGALDTWLQQIPDSPALLLKHRFRQELQASEP
ncbi:MAG: tetratricopeptide repeat protein [Thiopseudomonas sp.]|nr:tetratricopeptide repeat protein [Thiopseudomonas sp.]